MTEKLFNPENQKHPEEHNNGMEKIDQTAFDKFCDAKRKELIEGHWEDIIKAEMQRKNIRFRLSDEMPNISDNYIKLLIYDELKKQGRIFDEIVDKELVELAKLKDSIIKTANLHFERQNEIGKEVEENNKILLEKLKAGEKSALFLFNYLEWIKKGKREQLEELSTQREKSSAVMGFGFSETSFHRSYPAFLNIQLTTLLSGEQFTDFARIETLEDAERFVQSKPLSGKRIAEVGGSQTSVFEILGAVVDNPETLIKDGKFNQDLVYNINLETWDKVYREDSYDLVCSQMVLDKGTGIESMREDDYPVGVEMHSVFNKMLKNGGISLHITGALTWGNYDKGYGEKAVMVPFKKRLDQNQKRLKEKLLGKSQSASGFQGDPGLFIGDFIHSEVIPESEFFVDELGFKVKIYLPAQDCNVAGEYVMQFVKVSESKFSSPTEVRNFGTES